MKRMPMLGAVVLFVAAAAASDPGALRSLFQKEADVFADGNGLVRLELPPEVVAECQSGLSDLRLFDRDGQEVPFLLDAPRVETLETHETADAPVLEAQRDELPRERGHAQRRRETYELDGPAKPPAAGEWQLAMDIDRREFSATVRVVWSRSGGSDEGRREESIFRLASHRNVEKLTVPLAAEPLGKVKVVIEHAESFWIEPSFRFVSGQTVDRARKAEVSLSILSQHSGGGRTVVELQRPRGVVPSALRVATATATFDRPVSIADAGPGAEPAPLASGNVFRLTTDSGIAELEVSLRPARGDRLVVTIDDGDSPPLMRPEFTAVFSQPAIVAPLGIGGAKPVATLRFGGGRAKAPTYDLARLRPEPGREVAGKRADAVAAIFGAAGTRIGRLGAIRDNPAFDRTPALAFAMRPGAAIRISEFEWRRALEVKPSSEGLARLRLTPDDLAVLSSDLADLRIVDAGSRQWPYLIERADASSEVRLGISSTTKNRRTTYRLTGAAAPLTVSSLVVDCEVPFFNRKCRLTGRTEGDREATLYQGQLARTAGDSAPVTLTFPPARVDRLELVVDDGDDAPLPIRTAAARGPIDDVFVAAPAGAYSLLLGAEGLEPPRYELERARAVVLSVAAGDIQEKPMEKNPDFRVATRFTKGSGPAQVLIWVLLIAAVAILGGLTLKLARQGKEQVP